MKTPINMLEIAAANIIENTSLLELIYRNSNEDPETDNATACLIRSMQKTLDDINEYIEMSNDRRINESKQTTTSFRIQLARENLSLTEAELARKLGTYSNHISDWECGVTEPTASMILPLANALKCDPLWLLTGDIEAAEES